MRIQEHCRQIIRSIEPRLSTGAYGDEGRVFLELEQLVQSILRCEEVRHIEVALAWRDNSEMERLSSDVREAVTYLVTTFATRSLPRRLAMSQEEIEDVKGDLFNRLRESSVETFAEFKRLFERYGRVMEARETLELIRGGDEWLVLHRLDLLSCLSSWIIEVEMSGEGLVEGAA
ncbi:MAG: hypothetical protein U0P46_02940 [Holophagaceae bacterium]